MAYPVESIINIATRIRAAGLGLANFGQGMFFANFDSSTDAGFASGTYRDYGSSAAVAEDFPLDSDPYRAALAWFSAIPRPTQLRIYVRAEDDSPTESLLAAINAGVWFYWFDFESDATDSAEEILSLASNADANEKFFALTMTDALATAVRTPGSTDDVVSQLVAQGNRRVIPFVHATDRYAGFEAAAIASRVNFSAQNSTITLEFKKLPGIVAENLDLTAYNAMVSKGAVFYTAVETGGEVDNGRIINSKTTSTYGEFIDDVFNLDAFVNALKVGLYNALANPTTKIPQTPAGQLILINAAKQVGEQYIRNGYLGAREYTDLDTGETKLSRGYEVLTVPDDILSISEADRADRKAAPISMRLFRAGAVHTVEVTVDVE